MINSKKLLLVGIGTLGAIFAYKLLESNFDCKLVTNNDRATHIINQKGLTFKNKNKSGNIQAIAQTDLPENEQFDYIFLMTKIMNAVKSAGEIKAKNLLKENGILVTIQNGDVYNLISGIFPGQIATCIISWNAFFVEYGTSELTGEGNTQIGDYNNKLDLQELCAILSKVCPVQVKISTNIKGVVWSKLAINCAGNASAGLTGWLLKEINADEKGKALFFALYRETYELAQKLNIKLETSVARPNLFYLPKKPNSLDRAKIALAVKGANMKNGNTKFSLLQDIERGRPTEIDYLNGFVSKKAKEINFPTPVNDRMVELIKQIQDNTLRPDPKNLDLVEM